MENLIMDIDIGCDDAIALIMAMFEPNVDIKLVTTIFGNVGVEQATKNACFVIETLSPKDIPVYSGAKQGIKTRGINAKDVHGATGLGKKIVAVEGNKKPLNKRCYGAVEAMRDTILQYPNDIIILSVGPLTNVAKLLTKYPEVKSKIKRIVMEVGSIDGKGSITPYSSFNAYCDPEAVDIVIKSKVPITLTTKEVGTTAFYDEKQRETFKKAGRVGQFVYDLNEGYKDKLLNVGQYAVHDTCALFSILENDFYTKEQVDMVINTSNDEKRGQTKFVPNSKSHITLVTKLLDKQKIFDKMEEIISMS